MPPPEFTLLYAPGYLADPARDGTRSEAVILADLEQGAGIIGGTQYGGEEKKFFFYLMNYLMPLRGVMPMHCSANVGAAGDTSVLFGLSWDRQDHPLRRPRAAAVRRRRTRLGR